MAKTTRKKAAKFQKPVTHPLDLKKVLNFPGRAVRGEFLRGLAEQVRGFPTGSQTSWGMPFEMAGARSRARVILLRAGDEVTLPVGAQADYLCLLHQFTKAPDDQTTYTEAQPVGEYEFLYSDGSSARVPVRARLDVAIPEIIKEAVAGPGTAAQGQDTEDHSDRVLCGSLRFHNLFPFKMVSGSRDSKKMS